MPMKKLTAFLELELMICAAERQRTAEGVKKSSTDFRGLSKSLLDYLFRRFTLSSARLNKPQGWIFVETPFSAISRSGRDREKALPGSFSLPLSEQHSNKPTGERKRKTTMNPHKLILIPILLVCFGLAANAQVTDPEPRDLRNPHRAVVTESTPLNVDDFINVFDTAADQDVGVNFTTLVNSTTSIRNVSGVLQLLKETTSVLATSVPWRPA